MTEAMAEHGTGNGASKTRARRRGALSSVAGFISKCLDARYAKPSFGFLVVLVLIAILAPLIAPYDPLRTDAYAVLQGPSAAHWFGTDDLGRDVLARLIFGARISLLVGVSSVVLALLVGTAIGLAAGYQGKRFDEIVMRCMDAVSAFPALLLALGITAVLGVGIANVIIALAIVNVPTMARLVRGEVLSIREREYVTAAKALGFSDARILLRHILPGVAPAIVVQCMIEISHAVIAEASLSFLGVGVAAPAPSWGSLLNTGFLYLETAPWLWIVPGVAIFLTVFSFNMFGDGIRKAVDPRSSD